MVLTRSQLSTIRHQRMHTVYMLFVAAGIMLTTCGFIPSADLKEGKMNLLAQARNLLFDLVPSIHASAGGDNCWLPYNKCSDYCSAAYCEACRNGRRYACTVRFVQYSQDPTCPPYDIRECWECTCYCSDIGAC